MSPQSSSSRTTTVPSSMRSSYALATRRYSSDMENMIEGANLDMFGMEVVDRSTEFQRTSTLIIENGSAWPESGRIDRSDSARVEVFF